MFSKINFVHMPHKGWMKNNSLFTYNGWNCKPNPNSLPDTSWWLLPFSWWPLIFHFSSVTSPLRRHHLQHVCSFPPPLLHSTRFIQCWSLFNLHVAPAIFAQLFNFLYICDLLAKSLWHYLQSLIAPSSLSLSLLCIAFTINEPWQ